jgi:hypothetical protein
MKQKNWTTRILSWFAVFSLLGYGLSLSIVWYRFSSGVLFGVFVGIAALSFLLDRWLYGKKMRRMIARTYDVQFDKFRPLCFSRLLFPVYLGGYGVAVYLLASARSTEVLFTPWQVISPYYPFVLFFLTVLLGMFVIGKYKTKTILLFVILHSFLLHAYLPLSHTLPWGGDVWRTIGIEEKISSGEVVYPVLFGEGVEWNTVGPFDVPKIFTAPHKYVYGQLWGTTLLLRDAVELHMYSIQIWLVPILWSIVLPLIFFRMGAMLFGASRYGLWFATLTLIPFSFQALGGLTLAVSLGAISFFFTLMLWLQYVRERVAWQRILALFFASLLLFGHSVFAIVMWGIIVWTGGLFLVQRVGSRIVRIGAMTALVFSSAVVIPFVELFSRSSIVPKHIALVDGIKQSIGQFSGWFYALEIRPHDILSGNIIFNHTPDWAFVPSIFTSWRFHLVFLMMAIACGAVCALVHLFFEERRNEWYVIGALFLMVVVGYYIGWFVFEGDRSFVRRLDAIVAFLFVLFAYTGWHIIRKKTGMKVPGAYRGVVYLSCIIFFSWTTVTIAMSGPDMRVISEAEYRAAALVAQTAPSSTPCVLADTWVLLALEAQSHASIVGGGFPIDYQFGQPERVVLYQALLDDPRESILEVAQQMTGARACNIIVDSSLIEEEKIANLREILQEGGEMSGPFIIGNGRLKTP